MSVIRTEDEDRDWLGMSLAAALGLGLGIVAGIAVHELFGSVRERVVRVRRARRGRDTTSGDEQDALRGAVMDALTEHPATRSLKIDVRTLGNGIVELTGTAPDSDTRDLAGSTARAVAGASVVVNRMLVSDHDGSLRRSPSAAS